MQRLACICRRFKKANQSQSKTDGFRNFLYVCLNLLQKKINFKTNSKQIKKINNKKAT